MRKIQINSKYRNSFLTVAYLAIFLYISLSNAFNS